ncbi:hypothetical protein HXX76_013726 [Chlamydomonas incerta]|uniref:Pherophorin domain-containing protein n=1 Tax=Chlamydomonas incerta TaxID=51695 RepID=A0A835VQJ2_CHLIN|nr:hypothetical protein HXX76_013726 [Chlamydomonas incerta]|eukprot:KAG2425517.1 hypothetical protein HXX76_013726 [Chlamydomonas incerta]
MRHSASILALLAFVAAASAQLQFPYSGCTKALSKSKYSVKPVTTFPGTNTICWTVQYSNPQCANPAEECCNTDLHKLQLDVKPSCATGFKATATVNGQGTPAPTIYRPPNAGSDQYVLSIPGLGLNGPSANGASICLTLTGGSCMSLAALTPSPVWSVALWDDAHQCCPVCATWAAVAGPSVLVDDLNFFGGAGNCATGKDVISELFAPYLEDGTIIAGTDSVTCNGNKITACATTFSKEKGAKMATELEALGPDALVTAVFGFNGECPLSLAGYSVSVSSNNDDCGIFMAGPACAPPTTPFPFCVCNKAQGATPFYLDSAVEVETAANEYCLSVYTAAAAPGGGACASATTMKKAEFYFDYSMRWKLTGITIKYANGKTSTRSQSWGPVGDNTLKVSDLNWKTGDVASLKPKICFKFKSGTSLLDFSMDSSYVWASLFNPDQSCCPTFPAQE